MYSPQECVFDGRDACLEVYAVFEVLSPQESCSHLAHEPSSLELAPLDILKSKEVMKCIYQYLEPDLVPHIMTWPWSL